jgi:ribosome modulation factor
MATKADKLPDLNQFKTDAATADQAALDKIADSASKANAKKEAKAAKLANGPSEEVIKNNWLDISKQADKVKLAKALYDKEKQTLRSRYSTAEADGCNVPAFKQLRKFQEMDLSELDAEMMEVARIAGIVGSPVASCSFATMLETADKANPFTAGYAAGKNGDDATSNPNVPGSERFEKWANGWREGQNKILATAFGKKEDGKTASEKKPKKARAKKVKRSSGKALH